MSTGTEHIASPFELDEEAVRCPHRFSAAVREDHPVYFEPAIDAWVVSRDADVRRVIRETPRYSNRRVTGPVTARNLARAAHDLAGSGRATPQLLSRIQKGAAKVLIDADPPIHRRQRSAVGARFTPAAVAPLAPEVQAIADGLIDRFAARGTCEAVTEFTRPLPMRVIAEQLGVPSDDLQIFLDWSDAFTTGLGDHTVDPDSLLTALTAQADFFDYFTAQLERARERPREDVLTMVATAEIEGGGRLTLAEQLQMCAQFVVAGNETTAKSMSTALCFLAEDQDLQDKVRGNLDLVTPLIEEALRLESPTQGMFRTALEDVNVGGVDIPAGDHLFLWYASANRDPRRFDDGDRIELDRPQRAVHLAFGAGEHFCLGAHLARLEATVALRRFLERLDNIRIDASRPTRYERSYFIHGPTELHLTFAPRELRTTS